MSNTVTEYDQSAFQIPGMPEQRAENEALESLGYEYPTSPEVAPEEAVIDLNDIEIPSDASSLFTEDAAREEAMNVAVSSQEAPKPAVNAAEILRFTTNAGRELSTWRHIMVAAQDSEFIDALRTKAKNGRW